MFHKDILGKVRDLIGKANHEEVPSKFYRGLKGTKEFDVYFPELSALDKLDQDSVNHPEGDVFEHTMQVVDAVRYLSGVLPYDGYGGFIGEYKRGSTLVLSALMHDVGKAVTYSFNEKTGRVQFIDHEKMGVPIAEEFIYRFNIPNKEAIIYGVENHMKMHKAVKEMKSTKLVDLIDGKFNLIGKGEKGENHYEKTDGMRKTFGVQEFIILGMADTVGRLKRPQNLHSVLTIVGRLMAGDEAFNRDIERKLYISIGDEKSEGKMVKEIKEIMQNKQVLDRYEREREDNSEEKEKGDFKGHEIIRSKNSRLLTKIRTEVYGEG